jgi:hypothetical protein
MADAPQAERKQLLGETIIRELENLRDGYVHSKRYLEKVATATTGRPRGEVQDAIYALFSLDIIEVEDGMPGASDDTDEPAGRGYCLTGWFRGMLRDGI